MFTGSRVLFSCIETDFQWLHSPCVQVVSGDGAAVRVWSHVTGRRIATLQSHTGVAKGMYE